MTWRHREGAARGAVLRILTAVFSRLNPEGLQAVPELRGGYAYGLAYSDCRGDCPRLPLTMSRRRERNY